ncbi:hypothetical protein BDW72DRAFT_163869 [Aspergillus terricola var. indicus]
MDVLHFWNLVLWPVLCIIARASLEKGGLNNDSDAELTEDAALSSTCFTYRILHQQVMTESLSSCVTVISMRLSHPPKSKAKA